MTVVEYKAINSFNKIVFGSVNADQLDQLEEILNDQGLRLISYNSKQHKSQKLLNYPQQHALWMVLRYYMMSGFVLIDAVKYMIQGNTDVKLHSMLHTIYQRLQQGEMLSKIMKQYLPKNDTLSISLLETAETTGNHLEVLYDLEEYAAWHVNFKRKIHQSLRYPLIVFGSLWVSIFAILYFFAPQLKSYFQQTNYELPLLTTALLKLSQFVTQWPLLWIILPFVIVIGCKILYRAFPKKQTFWIYLPGLRSVILGYYYASLSKVLYLQLKHNHSLIDSLKTLQQAYISDWIHPVLAHILSNIEQGLSLSASLKQYDKIFSKFFIQLVSAGEQSNMLGDNFKVISAYYEQDTQYKVTNSIKLLEPLMLICMGVLLIIIVGGLFYPMYEHIGVITSGGL